jgi:hypothetical protein
VRTAQTAPSKHAVLERIGPTDGTKTTIYLTENPSAEFPLELRQELCEHIDRYLSREQLVEVSDHVPYKLKIGQHAFAKVVFIGVLPSKALALVRKAKAWFLESLVPKPMRRAEKKRRQHRANIIKMSRRRERHTGRQFCRSQRFA